MNDIIVILLIVWILFGGSICGSTLMMNVNLSKKQTVVLFILGGPTLWAFGTLILVMLCVWGILEKLKIIKFLNWIWKDVLG